ncbi:MAG: 50S ribosomal protein L3 [Oceanococcaceae bacterium]
MSTALVARKCGMTRIFLDSGESVPVTVLEVLPNRVTAIKTVDTDGYNAIQVTTGGKKPSRLSRPEQGQFEKSGSAPGRGLWEVGYAEGIEVGAELTVTQFAEDALVDVVGTSIGKGFAGTIKRHNFSGQRQTHGNSLSHRVPGSIGQNQTPGRVFPGKKMAGHMGNARVTTQNLRVVRIDAERNLMMVKGAVPGAKGGDVIVRPAVKA